MVNRTEHRERKGRREREQKPIFTSLCRQLNGETLCRVKKKRKSHPAGNDSCHRRVEPNSPPFRVVPLRRPSDRHKAILLYLRRVHRRQQQIRQFPSAVGNSSRHFVPRIVQRRLKEIPPVRLPLPPFNYKEGEGDIFHEAFTSRQIDRRRSLIEECFDSY